MQREHYAANSIYSAVCVQKMCLIYKARCSRYCFVRCFCFFGHRLDFSAQSYMFSWSVAFGASCCHRCPTFSLLAHAIYLYRVIYISWNVMDAAMVESIVDHGRARGHSSLTKGDIHHGRYHGPVDDSMTTVDHGRTHGHIQGSVHGPAYVRGPTLTPTQEPYNAAMDASMGPSMDEVMTDNWSTMAGAVDDQGRPWRRS